MCTTKPLSMRKAQQSCQPALKYLQDHMVLRLWTPSIGQRTNLSTRDGNYGHKRLDSPLMPWRETQRKPRFLTFIIGSMEMVLHRLKHGKTTKILISQSAYDALESKEGKYSSEHIESYFTLFELSLVPRSNPLLAVEDLYFAKQGSMTSGEFHSHIVKIVKRCQIPMSRSRGKRYKGCHLYGYEQSMGQR